MFTGKFGKFRNAIISDNTEKMAALIEKYGVDTMLEHKYHIYTEYYYDTPYNTYGSALEGAAYSGRINATKFLLDQKFDFSDKYETSLYHALNQKHFETFCTVLEHTTLSQTNILLHKSIEKKLFRFFEKLIDAGANINTLNTDQKTPLHIALQIDEPAFIEKLLSLEARTDIPDAKGLTAKHLMTQNNIASMHKPENQWILLDPENIAHIKTFPNIQKKITDIFNFKGQERIILTENLEKNAEGVSAPIPFEDLKSNTLQEAFEKYKSALNGKIPNTITPPVFKPTHQKKI